jgi:hypothetical protein
MVISPRRSRGAPMVESEEAVMRHQPSGSGRLPIASY